MNEEIQKIINDICAQLGVASQYAITEMAKYKIASNIVPLLIGVICIIICRFTYTHTNKHIKERNEEELIWAEKNNREPQLYGWFKPCDGYNLEYQIIIAWCVLGVLGFAAIALLATSLNEILTWLIAPTGSMINYILNAIK